ncbi:hypothetical protein ACFWJ4_17075 [Kitasatospora sp. NPDC127067]|uniref:hypothetical protein n=1 Tax=Kitasatospora sp. NPDC127067 TaxID=3347126 RepID=UPI0036692F16
MLTEQLSVPPPVVIGLLRTAVAVGLPRRRALTGVLDAFCERQELHLVGVITDEGVEPDALIAGIEEQRDVYAVVLPTIAHLGDQAAANRRRKHLEDVGIRLLVTRT